MHFDIFQIIYYSEVRGRQLYNNRLSLLIFVQDDNANGKYHNKISKNIINVVKSMINAQFKNNIKFQKLTKLTASIKVDNYSF